MKRAAERQGDGLVSKPAQLDDCRLDARELKGELETRGRAARVNDEVRVARRHCRLGEPNAHGTGHLGAAGIDIHEFDIASWDSRGEPGRETPHRARPNHRDTIAHMRSGVPHPIERRLEIRGQHGAARWNSVRHDVHRRSRDDELRLMGIKHEHRAAPQLVRAAHHTADTGVAVLHGRRKLAGLEGRAHPTPFTARDAAAEDERLGPSADTAVQRLHHDLAGGRRPKRFAANFATAGRRHPECPRSVLHAWTF